MINMSKKEPTLSDIMTKLTEMQDDITTIKGDIKILNREMKVVKSDIKEIKGGKADEMTPKDIAKKFGVKLKDVKKQIEKGKKVEAEHTDDEGKETEIAMDHLSEYPDYYDRLEKMEKEADKYWSEKVNESKKIIKSILRETTKKEG